MNCEEELIRRLSAALMGDVAPDLIRLISGRLSEALNDYEVTPKTQELVPRADALPKSVLEYIGAKTVEGLSQGSIDQYALVLRQFYADIRLQDTQITPRILRAWLYAYPKAHPTRSGAPVSEHTLSNKRLILHGYFEWAANNGYIPTNPCRAVAKIRYAKPCRRPLTEEQLAQLRYAAETEKERALLEVLYSSGCRVSELCRLNISDVCLQDRSVHLFGKGRKHRTSYISAAAVIALYQRITPFQSPLSTQYVDLLTPRRDLFLFFRRFRAANCHGLFLGDPASVGRLPHLVGGQLVHTVLGSDKIKKHFSCLP